LLGIVLATETEKDHGGWTYAIPASHVQRLLAVRAQEQSDDGVVILKRRRPVVGMVLDATEDGVVVSRVFEDSPAQRAGILVNDRVVAADGTRIRSVYQAVRPMLYKQPGDKMSFLITRGSEIVEAEVVLGGGIELPSAPLANLQQYLRPKLDVRKIGEGLYATREPHGPAEVFSAEGSEQPAEAPVSAAQRIELLTKAVDRYQQALIYLKERLHREEQQRRAAEERLRDLEQQVEGQRN
jgi:membrane-associated protease RseP (regulator of RpoE activity)